MPEVRETDRQRGRRFVLFMLRVGFPEFIT